jgi:ubiquinone/menaquinone biosynthesis C-methylase UbiE
MEADEYDLMDAAEATMWWYRALHTRLIDALAPLTGRLLDAGCGTGGFLTALARARPDLALAGIEYLPSAAHRAAIKSGAAIAAASIMSLPFPDASFDAVVSADVLCHEAVRPQAALTELHRVAKPGATLILNMPAYTWLASAHDRRVHNARRTTPAGLRMWLTLAGFTQIRTTYWNGLLLPLMVAQRKILARGDAASDVAAFPPWLDATLYAVTRIERHLPFPLPAGGSILAVANRPLSEPAS